MWRDSPGALHRHVKPPTIVRDEHTDAEGNTYATPCQIMDRRADSWEKVWTDSAAAQTSILDGLKVVMSKAKQEDVDPIALEQLDTVVGRLNAKKAKGIGA
eukprot:3981172-Pyramimonas_sp.AAC.1